MTSLRELARRDGARRRPRTAFVLSGGGNLGAIQVGMLRALAEREVVPDVVLGCSIGALNGAAYASNPTTGGIDALVAHWEGSGDSVMPSSRIPSAVQLLRKGASLHSNDGLRSGIETLLGPARRFEELALPFQCVAVDVDEAIERWFDDGDLTEAILASAALPAVYPPVTIDGRRYVDGGVVDNVPIARAVALGCRTIYVLQVGPHGRPDIEIRRPLDGALLAYWVARNSRFARDLASLPERVDAVVLPPGERPDLRYDDFGHTSELVEQGYSNAASFLDDRAAELDQRRRASDVLRPIQRLVLSARSDRQVQRIANSPDGAIVSGGRSDGRGPDDSDDAGDADDGGPSDHDELDRPDGSDDPRTPRGSEHTTASAPGAARRSGAGPRGDPGGAGGREPAR